MNKLTKIQTNKQTKQSKTKVTQSHKKQQQNKTKQNKANTNEKIYKYQHRCRRKL
jgi:hypothetical protein